jgi:SAM-dependent methyltransferase
MSRDDRWLVERMATEAIERLDAVSRPLHDALVIGLGWDLLGPELERRGISGRVLPNGVEEDMPFAEAASADLIIACGTLDTVNDLPGALALARRTLRPGGLFLGSMAGAGSLAGLRALIASAERDGPVAARFHPMIDVRAAGDLLTRAGFVLPVAESDTINVNYRTLDRLLGDIRGAALSNCLASRVRLPRTASNALRAAFEAPFAESFNLLSLTGWSPER